jgi:hypothetical protein
LGWWSLLAAPFEVALVLKLAPASVTINSVLR